MVFTAVMVYFAKHKIVGGDALFGLTVIGACELFCELGLIAFSLSH